MTNRANLRPQPTETNFRGQRSNCDGFSQDANTHPSLFAVPARPRFSPATKTSSSKSLMRFCSVCTTWRSLIADPHFVKKHMKYDAERGLNDNDVRLLFSMKPPSTMGLSDLKHAELDSKTLPDDRVPVRELVFPVCLDFVTDVVNVGSCNGIGCVHFNEDYVLWNPCTGEHNVLPKPPSDVSCYSRYYGFGYDEINDDYKVVLGSHSEYGVYGPMEPLVHVFSMRKGTWNTYPGQRNSDRRWTIMRGQGGCVNGVLHWLLLEESAWDVPSMVIMPFSLAEEKFLQVMLIPGDKISGILISGNHLCVHHDRGPVRILMMKEYGVKESWTEVLYLTFWTVPQIYD